MFLLGRGGVVVCTGTKGSAEFSRSESVHVVRFEFGDIDHLFKIISNFDNINVI